MHRIYYKQLLSGDHTPVYYQTFPPVSLLTGVLMIEWEKGLTLLKGALYWKIRFNMKAAGYDTIEQIVQKCREGDHYAFALLVHQWYIGLCFLAKRIIDQARMAETLVERALVALWIHRQEFEDGMAMKKFLFYSTRQYCLEYIRLRQGEFLNTALTKYVAFESLEFIDNELNQPELPRQLHYDPVGNLPQACLEAIRASIPGAGSGETARNRAV